MNHARFFINHRAGRPATRPWLVSLLLLPVALAAVALGIFFFAAFVALFTVIAAAVGLRLWWLRRSLRRAAAAGEPPPGATSRAQRRRPPGEVLEGEFVVVQKHESEQRE
jgi:Flp pilus assembly protein TadB